MADETRRVQFHPIPKRRRWRTNLLVSILIFVVLAVGIGVWATHDYIWRFPASQAAPPPRALILDELSLSYPDPSFVGNVTSSLASRGYSVSYVGVVANAISVFQQLPRQGYSLVIIRAHQGGGQAIVTTQPYSKSQYVSDQQSGALAAAEIGDGPLYFALTPRFVSQVMQGRFAGTTVIVMGCAALQGTTDLATAFLDKGAEFFVGWDGAVTIIHTDVSTVSLVRQLADGSSVPDATRVAGGVDPVFGAHLEYLSWNMLVQGRMNSLVSAAVIWSFLATILILGPLAVFVAPRLFDAVGRARERVSRHDKKKPSTKRSS